MPALGRGELIRPFSLRSPQGDEVHTDEFHGRFNLVLVFAEELERPSLQALLQSYARVQEAFREQEAGVLFVLRRVASEGEPRAGDVSAVSVLIDREGETHELYDISDDPAVYVTDRWGEVYAVYPEPRSLPGPETVLKDLEFINHQCPECFPPEWPQQGAA